jgi:glycosylphosphatidylinositol transamidase
MIAFAVIYVPLLVVLMGERRRSESKDEPDERKRSIQFAACLLALYLHVAITFGHVALSFPSALLWTPLIAFPSCGNAQRRGRHALESVARWMVVVASSPLLLVPAVFPTFTPYVRYLYIPLHLFAAMLWL